MRFQKGVKRHPNAGRKKGVCNKVSLEYTADVLIRKGINPTEELLNLIPGLSDENKLKAWGLILTYSQPKPSEMKSSGENSVDEIAERLRDVSDAQLISIVQNVEAKNNGRS